MTNDFTEKLVSHYVKAMHAYCKWREHRSMASEGVPIFNGEGEPYSVKLLRGYLKASERGLQE